MSEIARIQQPGNLMPSVPEWQMMKEQATMLVATGFLPKAVDTPQKAIAIMLKGRELNMPPMQSFSHINIIQGKPTISAEGMLALIFRAYPKTRLNYLQNDDVACIIDVTKPGNDPNRFSFSYEDAQKAKLTSKDNWNTYRRSMLRSRCISEMARAVFPDALMGVSYTPEELEDDHAVVKEAKPVAAIFNPPKAEEPKPEIKTFNKHDPEQVMKLVDHLAKNDVPDFLNGAVIDILDGQPLTVRSITDAVMRVNAESVST